MTPETAIALFAVMSPEQQASILAVYDGIAGAFQDVREAFAQAVDDECLVIETEKLLLQMNGTQCNN